MFERYTEKARRVIFFGRYEASQMGSPYIETEHLLLGIIREDKGLVTQFIKSHAAIKSIHEEVERYAAKEKVPLSVDLPLSNEGKHVLEHAAKEAELLSHKHVGTEHLLLGILREEKCFAAELLRERGLSLLNARDTIRSIANERQTSVERPVTAPARTASLADFGIDLTDQAINGILPNLIGREQELEAVIRTLCRSAKGNPVLVGEPGVGKRTIVNGLAHRMSDTQVPARLHDRKLIALDLGVIGSGDNSRSRFEERVDSILRGLEDSRLIVFIEGMHSLVQTPRFLNLVNVLKPALQSRDLQCISTAGPAEYPRAIEAAPWLERLFTPIQIRPMDEAEALKVLRRIKDHFERFHGVTYTDEALQYAVFHSNSHFPNHYLPEKAIDVIDEAAALKQVNFPPAIMEVHKRIKLMEERHKTALTNNEFEKARFYADELKRERARFDVLPDKYKADFQTPVTITRDDIEKIVAERTGASIESLRRSLIPEKPEGQST
jgi:ATP-dependent Clp protease ATP-binding subunit ClpC